MNVFFMHIPKTAGSSLRRFLERSMRERGRDVLDLARDGIWSEESASYPAYTDFIREDPEELKTRDLICGHYPYHVVRMLDPDIQVVTLLRDPLDRCVSHIKYQISYERQVQPDHPELASDVNDFIAMPRNEMFLGTLANLAVKYLSFEGQPDLPVPEEEPSLEVAVMNCQKTHFGFVDELEAFQHRLDTALFDKHVDALPVRFDNISPNRFSSADLTPENTAHLQKINALDIELDRQMRERLQPAAPRSLRERAMALLRRRRP